MENEILIAGQTIAFGLVVIARMHLTSHLARKRLWGFILSIVAAVVFMTIMISQGLYILAAMDVTIMALDARGVINNYREAKGSTGLLREVDTND